MSDAPPAKLRSDREPPPYFAGRAKELATLNKRLNDLRETGGPTGGMALIVGVPGAGKTQLGRKFAADALAHGAALDIRHLATDTSMLEDDVDLFMAIARALGVAKKGRKVADIDTRNTGRNASKGLLRGGLTQEHARHTGRLSALLDASKHAGVWNRKVLVLVVDELQTIQPEGMRALRVLHQGDHGCPILLVGIGLQHTQHVLGNPADGSAGISRVAAPITLEALSDGEALEAIKRNMLAMGHEIPRACVVALADASQGFPQHIHGYLNGAIEAIRKHGSLDVGRSLDDALKAGDQARTDYYDARLSMLTDQDAMLPVIETMVDTGRTWLRRSEAVSAIYGGPSAATASLDGENTVRQAIAHGVLTLQKGGVSFGMPSFHSRMVELLQEHRQRGKQLRSERAALGTP